MDLPSVYADVVIDVSHYQKDIDWKAVRAAGILLAFIKATQGSTYTDPKFEDNMNGADDAGIMTVPYHFLTNAKPADQADYFLSVVDPQKGDPIMIDWETEGTSVLIPTIFGKAVETVIQRPPLAYYGWAQLRAPDIVLSRWPLMLPEYPKGTAPGDYRKLVSKAPGHLPPGRSDNRPYDFHQYTPAGRIAGISTPVDRCIWVGDEADLKVWYTFGDAPVPAQPTA